MSEWLWGEWRQVYKLSSQPAFVRKRSTVFSELEIGRKEGLRKMYFSGTVAQLRGFTSNNLSPFSEVE